MGNETNVPKHEPEKWIDRSLLLSSVGAHFPQAVVMAGELTPWVKNGVKIIRFNQSLWQQAKSLYKYSESSKSTRQPTIYFAGINQIHLSSSGYPSTATTCMYLTIHCRQQDMDGGYVINLTHDSHTGKTNFIMHIQYKDREWSCIVITLIGTNSNQNT